jgi:hypothetical protein
MSQNAKKNAARTAATRNEASPVEALNREIQRTPAMRCAIAQAAHKRTEGAESRPADRWCGSASETSIHVLRRSAELSCSPKQGKYRRMIEHAYRIQKARRFYEHDAILVSLLAQAEAIDHRCKRRRLAASAQQAALDAGATGTKPGKKIWKDDAPPNLPPPVTRPVRPIFSYSPPKR